MCYQCGKREAKINGLCEPCFLEKQPPLLIKNVKVRVCRECNSYCIDRWRQASLEDITREYINAEDADISIEEHGNTYVVTVVARQIFHKDQTHPLVQQAQFSMYMKDSLCNQCSKMVSGYYEAILQVRRLNNVLTEKERALCSHIVVNGLREKDFVSRIKERKEGTDFYFSSTKAAKQASEALKKQLGGKIKESYRTVGFNRQKGTDIKRGTILFQMHEYKPGEIIFLQDAVYQVESAVQKLRLKNAHQEKVLPWKKVEYLEHAHQLYRIVPSDYSLETCQVLDVTPSSVLVMHPDFTTAYLERPKGIKVDTGKRYRILFFRKNAYWM
jgi:nonsense-mediated mRNA decay protein 3